MDTSPAPESQLLPEIERLREQFPHTPDLYREVCVVLFFRYGITPTTNKLYQLVRKGSMSAPAEALNKFWEDLRDKSRIRIEHPDLPESLKTAAADLIATLWTQAQAAAQESVATIRSETQASVLEAHTALTAAEADRDAVRQQQEKTQQALEQAQERIQTLEQQLAAVGATHAAIEAQLREARADAAIHLQRLEDARRDFTAELEKSRAAAVTAEERFRAAETRALLEIDRERNTASKLSKELEAVRSAAQQAEKQHRAELTALQEQLGNAKQEAGVLQGNLQAVTANRDLATEEIKTLQTQLSQATALLSSARLEADTWHANAEQAEQRLLELQQNGKPKRTTKKPKAPPESQG